MKPTGSTGRAQGDAAQTQSGIMFGTPAILPAGDWIALLAMRGSADDKVLLLAG